MKLEEILEHNEGLREDPSVDPMLVLDHDVRQALMDISERLQALEHGLATLTLRLNAHEYLALAEQGKE